MKKQCSEQITDFYLITMLLLFPLFFGFSGYSKITVSKFVFFLAATGLWTAALAVAALCGRVAAPKLRPEHFAAGALAAVAVLSWALCGDRKLSFLGAGRFDGLLSTLGYCLIFLGVSLFARPKRLHLRALALGVSLCMLVALLQLMGLDPLRLFPRGLDYYGGGVRYSGFFLGTIGNTNLLDALACLALPLFFCAYVCAGDAAALVPAALSVPVLWKAGGDGLKLALLIAALAAPPLMLTRREHIVRFLRAAALLLAIAALSALWQPSSGHPFHFSFSALPPALLLAAAVLAAASHLRLPRGFMPVSRELRRCFLICSCAAALAGFLALYCGNWKSGTLYEFSEMLHGRFDGSFGSNRIRIWRECLAFVPARPLLGYGPGMLAANVDILFTRFVPETGETLMAQVDNAHNVYLAALVNTGVLGLSAHLAVLLLAARRAWNAQDAPLRLPLAVAVLCAAVHAFFGLGLCITEPLFWLALGLVCAETNDAPVEGASFVSA